VSCGDICARCGRGECLVETFVHGVAVVSVL
jgi:hypothetical protein